MKVASFSLHPTHASQPYGVSAGFGGPAMGLIKSAAALARRLWTDHTASIELARFGSFLKRDVGCSMFSSELACDRDRARLSGLAT